ncbi:acyl carrier protein phosphodiesterase [Aquimarina agarilytica]|uniref:acyl carrier protein phosphodiesterase n=1 Tax=Aquimarina agarilytica TaxID=1087449 RepID=UPI00028954C6|nr:acyl carrier protein phosphodiesterase [Aquimarina agarilytica]
MNYLAHIYLSYNNPQVQIGNFIADSVKGNKYLNYSDEIKKGIIIHRSIDTFTDQHLITKQCKKVFSSYGHYAGVITDIIFDHFLAKNWANYHSSPLEKYTLDFYRLLQKNYDTLPKRVQFFLPVMIAENWIYNYRTVGGISDILYQMNRRTKNISKMNYAVIELNENYNYLENQFTQFFKELEAYVVSETQVSSL